MGSYILYGFITQSYIYAIHVKMNNYRLQLIKAKAMPQQRPYILQTAIACGN